MCSRDQLQELVFDGVGIEPRLAGQFQQRKKIGHASVVSSNSVVFCGKELFSAAEARTTSISGSGSVRVNSDSPSGAEAFAARASGRGIGILHFESAV